MKPLLTYAALLFSGLLVGLILGFAVTVPRKVGIDQVEVSKQVLGRRDVLIVDSIEHPPWAQQHLTSVEFDEEGKTISIVRYAVILSPGIPHSIYSRWPVVIRDGLLSGEYTLQVWRGERFARVGRVVVEGSQIEYVPLDEKW